MKTVKIGNEEYRQKETPFDIGDERFVVFKQCFLQIFEAMDTPLFNKMFATVAAYYNSGNHADAIIELHNYKKAIELKSINYDAYTFCFALITMQEGEQEHEFTKDIQEKKIAKMREQGLTRGQVEADVVNFSKAFPETLGAYLEMLRVMTAHQLEEV